MTAGELKGIKLIGAGLAIPLCVGVPWALFGDAVPDALKGFFGPRALGQLTAAAAILCAVLLGRGVFTLIREARASEDPRAAKRKLLILLLASSLVSGGLSASVFAYYGSQHQQASLTCSAAEGLAIPLQRQALRDAESALSKVRFFNESVYSCEKLASGLKRIEQGECPELVPPDARCRCGSQRFPEDWSEARPAKCMRYADDGSRRAERALRAK
ncbi:MAG: hypothetical protein H6718_19485 [Polyangiaceae bacterium]|nr:hypothetical protein [Myxococcales bacterium]MCB9587594.1 hypothetical protein [Polyangiaceae bacterium]MCB9605609.1 hypothetical protein [Polyangiaceae bacterium]